MVPFESMGAVSYSHSIVTMAVSCIVSDIKRDIGRKSLFFHTPPAFNARFRGSPSEYTAMPFGSHTEKNGNGIATRWWKTFSHFDKTPRVTERQTDGRHSPHYA